MLTEAETLAAIRLDPSAPAVLVGQQLAAQQAGKAQVAALTALLMPEDVTDV